MSASNDILNGSTLTPSKWDIARVRRLVKDKFGKVACWWQVQIALGLYEREDIIGVAPTGAGKTLTFWLPTLMALDDGLQDRISFVVTPLNLLGKQNVQQLEKAGICAIAVSSDNSNNKTFDDIAAGKYNIVVISPEILMTDARIQALWKKPKFTRRILNFIFDEGHCISQWGSFRKEYRLVGNLRHLIPDVIPFYVASATLPAIVLVDVADILHLRLGSERGKIIRSNDRPDLRLYARQLLFAANSYQDLAFLIPKHRKEGDAPPKFLVFFDRTKDAEAACRFVRILLPENERGKLKYFHATMTGEYREKILDGLQDSEVWGVFCTDACGMGMDVADIEIVVQFKATCDLCTLWQRFGRAARGADCEGTVILLYEKKDIFSQENGEGIGMAGEKRTADEEFIVEAPPVKRSRTSTGLTALPCQSICVHVPGGDSGEAAAAGGQEMTGSEGQRKAKRGKAVKKGSAAAKTTEPAVGTSNEKAAKIQQRKHAYLKADRAALKPQSSLKKPQSSRGKAHAIDNDGPMADFINVPSPFSCRREVLMVYFGNDKITTDDYLYCDQMRPDGCQRCAPKAPTICCDFCFSSFFVPYTMSTSDCSLTKGTGNGKSRGLKLEQETDQDKRLRDDLWTWRQEKAILKFGLCFYEDHGACVFMDDDVIERIVVCAHHNKIIKADDIRRETSWPNQVKWIAELFPSLLELIHKYSPPPSPPPDASAVLGVSGRQCSACQQFGHIKSNSMCPAKLAAKQYPSPSPSTPATASRCAKENNAPITYTNPTPPARPYLGYFAPSPGYYPPPPINQPHYTYPPPPMNTFLAPRTPSSGSFPHAAHAWAAWPPLTDDRLS